MSGSVPPVVGIYNVGEVVLKDIRVDEDLGGRWCVVATANHGHAGAEGRSDKVVEWNLTESPVAIRSVDIVAPRIFIVFVICMRQEIRIV